MPFLKKLLAPILKFKKQQRAAGKPWPPVPKDAPVLRWHQAMAKAGPVPPVATVDPKADLAVLIYTGGTTGVAKGAMLSHANLAVERPAGVGLDHLDRGGEGRRARGPAVLPLVRAARDGAHRPDRGRSSSSCRTRGTST